MAEPTPEELQEILRGMRERGTPDISPSDVTLGGRGGLDVPTAGLEAGETPEHVAARMRVRRQREERRREMPYGVGFTSQFYASLADTLGLPAELAREAGTAVATRLARLTGQAGPEGALELATAADRTRRGPATEPNIMERLTEPGATARFIADAMRSAGLRVADQEPILWEEKLGANLLPFLLMSAGVFGGARAAAGLATTGGTEFTRSVGRVAGDITRRPATYAAYELGAVPGITAAQHYLEPIINETLPGTEWPTVAGVTRETTNTLLEILAGGPTAWLGAKAGRIPTYARRTAGGGFELRGRLIPDTEVIPDTPTPTRPIISSTADPEFAAARLRVQAITQLDRVDRSIAAALERVAPAGIDEQAASRQMYDALVGARTYARGVERAAWDGVPMTITGEPAMTATIAEGFLRTAQANSTAFEYPMEMLTTIRNNITQIDQRTGARVLRNDIPLRRLAAWRTELMRLSDEAAATSVLQARPRAVLSRNIDALVTQLTRDIDRIGEGAQPGFRAIIEYAREMSRMFNDRFTRGPIGQLLMTTRQAPEVQPGQAMPIGTRRVPASQTARTMLGMEEGPAAVLQAADRFGYGPRTHIQRNVFTTAREAIAAMFRQDILDDFMARQAAAPRVTPDVPTTFSGQAGPGQAAVLQAERWIRDNQHKIEGFVGVTTDLINTVGLLGRRMALRNRYTQQITANFIGQPADRVIRAALTGASPSRDFTRLYRMARNEPEVLEGLQRALMDDVLRGAGTDPDVALARLRQTPHREAFSRLFRNEPTIPERFHRLLVLASDWRRFANEELPTRSKIGRGIVRNIAGPVSLVLGGTIARMLPGKHQAASLSIPFRMNRAAREFVDAFWERNADYVLSRLRDAMFNPGIERDLLDAAPDGLQFQRQRLRRLQIELRRINTLFYDDVQGILDSGKRIRAEENRAVREEEAKIRRGL